MKNHKPIAARYGRYSTQEQGEGAFSTIAAQDEATGRFVAEQGWQDAGYWCDEGRTGTNINRPGFRALLAAVRDGEIDTVVVTFMNRLGRGSAYTIAEYELKQAGARVVTCREAFGDGLAGYAHRSMTQMMDGMYPVMVREWTEAKMVEMLARGYHCAGKAPIGYRAVPVEDDARPGKTPPKRLVIDEPSAAVVREAFAEAAAGGAPAALALLREAFPARAWSHGAASYLLRNRVYTGVATWGRHINEAAHPAIIDEEMFASVQESLGEDRRTYRPRVTSSEESAGAFWLRGRVFCSCGARMTQYSCKGRNKKSYHYYKCLRAVKFAAPCPRRQVSAIALHAATVGEMLSAAAHPWRLRRLLSAGAERAGDTKSLEAQDLILSRRIESLARQAQRLLESVGRVSGVALPGILAQLEKVEAERRDLKTEQMALRGDILRARAERPRASDVSRVLGRMGELWGAATPEERAEIIDATIARVELKEGSGVVTYIRLDSGSGEQSSEQVARESEFSCNSSEKGRIYSRPLILATLKTLLAGRERPANGKPTG